MFNNWGSLGHRNEMKVIATWNGAHLFHSSIIVFQHNPRAFILLLQGSKTSVIVETGILHFQPLANSRFHFLLNEESATCKILLQQLKEVVILWTNISSIGWSNPVGPSLLYAYFWTFSSSLHHFLTFLLPLHQRTFQSIGVNYTLRHVFRPHYRLFAGHCSPCKSTYTRSSIWPTASCTICRMLPLLW